jgi:uncharacterized protein YdiU (UPF0061 family)
MHDDATIQDLPVRHSKVLTNEIKKSLVKIIEDEFGNQATMFDAKIQEEKDKVMTAYKKRVGFDGLVEQLEEAERNVERVKAKLEKTGMNKSGELLTGWNVDEAARTSARKLQAELDKVTAAIKPAANLKNKIVSRLLIAENYGEAMVIMHNVLGNGVIPAIKKADLEKLAIEGPK